MKFRTPSAWTVSLLAALAGTLFGSGTAALSMALKPMRIGDFTGASDVAGGPQVGVVATEHDFGTMRSGLSGTHRFTLTNDGTATLSLSKGVSSCRCTVADLARTEIPTGESTDVIVEWKTKADSGPFRQTVSVMTNDPRRPEVAFSILGTVVSAWQAVPSTVVFPRLGTHGLERASVKLFTYESSPTSIARLSTTESAVSDATDAAEPFSFDHRRLSPAELAEENDPRATAGYVIDVAARPGLPIGPIRRTMRVEFTPEDGEDGPAGGDGFVAEIPIEGTVAGDLAVAGKAWDSSRHLVHLGHVTAAKGLRTELFLTVKGPNRDAAAIRVKEVVPESIHVVVGEAKPIGSGSVRRVPIEITIAPGSPACNHLGNQQGEAGRIVLETGLPDAPLFTMPVVVAVGP